MANTEKTPPPAPRPSVFISYASEDRPAAKALRDALLAVGLEVWYDENELTGGDAWDQKIRRQIRDCDYFMPLISATTERRKEGYFRREWRLAAERTMDMADDVLFLLPIAIDDTSEAGARVPDRFLTVQWLRLPGGQRTPALDALAQRLLAGEHHAPPRPPLVTRPPMTMPPMMTAPAAAPDAHPHAPPPMPPFPHAPEKGGIGHWLKFFAEVIWWAISAAWIVLNRLPRWLRILISVWLVFMLISTCNRSGSEKPKSRKVPEPASAAEVERAAKANAEAERAANVTVEQIVSLIEKHASTKDWGKLGDELGRKFGGGPERPAGARKMLVFVPFAPDPEDPSVTQFAQNVFSRAYGQLMMVRRNEAAISPVLPASNTDAALVALGQQNRADYVVGTQLTKSADGARVLSLRLIHTQDGTVAWSEEYPIHKGDPKELGAKIAEAIGSHLPAPQPPRKRQ